MSLGLVSIIILSILQLLLSFGFSVFIQFIGRALFLSRLVGLVIKPKVSYGFEIAGVFIVLVSQFIFNNGPKNWRYIVITVAVSAIVMLIEFVHDRFNVYITEDVDDDL